MSKKFFCLKVCGFILWGQICLHEHHEINWFYTFQTFLMAKNYTFQWKFLLQNDTFQTKQPNNCPKKIMTNTNMTSRRKLFIISHRKHGNHRKGFAQPCGMLLKRTQISQITQICFPFFRLLSVSSVINIYLRNQWDLHDLWNLTILL